MKNLLNSLLCASITLYSLSSAAQTQKVIVNEPDYNKPRLFDNLPEVIPVSIDNLNDLINAKTGASINTGLSPDTKTVHFEGKVMSTISKNDDRVQTVVIKSTNYNGATLFISKVLMEDGNIKYNGRLMSFRHGDLYVLRQKGDGFELVKKNFYDLVNE